jgi:hypothetical protein
MCSTEAWVAGRRGMQLFFEVDIRPNATGAPLVADTRIEYHGIAGRD